MIYYRIKGGLVVDRIVFDAPMPDEWPDRAEWTESDVAHIGWSYDGKDFAPPPPKPEPEPEPTLIDPIRAELDDLKTRLAALEAGASAKR